MNLRSVTAFLSLTDPIQHSQFRDLENFFSAAREAFTRMGFPVQTTRVATQPISDIAPRDLIRFARELESVGQANGITYTALGAVRADSSSASLDLIDSIPPAIAATENVFASVQIASRANGINLRAIQAAARAIRALAASTDASSRGNPETNGKKSPPRDDASIDGLGNFRFAALANCPPHSPFFPAAYHQGDLGHDGNAPTFAIATEGAPLAVDAFTRARSPKGTFSLENARANLVEAIETAGQKLARVADDLAARFSYRFAGIDFSLAPYKEESDSLGYAIEKLTGTPFGEHGTLFAVAFITDCIQRANFPRVGFSGVMLPLLEDSILAARSSRFTIHDLLLYSAVCGTGLDTIPLPGDVSADELAAILLDLATLAVKLDKPLTARLIPIPNARVGDMTHFDFPWFTNARIMEPRGALSREWMEKNEWVRFGGKG